MDTNLPLRGKCTWWREAPNSDDQWDTRLKKDDKRVDCTCFVEGKGWEYAAKDVPSDCPDARQCRYYVKHV